MDSDKNSRTECYIVYRTADGLRTKKIYPGIHLAMKRMKQKGQVWEWWTVCATDPVTAKEVVRRNYAKGIHEPDERER